MIGLQRFYLTIVKELDRDASNRRVYLAKCICGKKKAVKRRKFLENKVKSCGCRSLENIKINLTGKRFGKLVVGNAITKNKRQHWKCLCDCGKQVLVRGDSLTSRNTNSCGCLLVQVDLSYFLGNSNRKHLSSLNRVKKLSRLPKWANLAKIKEIYAKCPQGLEVDHIIPLKGKNVCGLHVENNLQ
jgi:hypothetical protein